MKGSNASIDIKQGCEGSERAMTRKLLREAEMFAVGRRNRIQRKFGRLKDWRRISTRYDPCPKVFMSAIALASTVILWL